jgi:uncharacterized membrane protein
MSYNIEPEKKYDNSPSPHFDMNTLINLQKQYAMDLQNIPVNVENNYHINDLNDKLNKINVSLTNSQYGAQSVLYKQKIINKILDTEKQRLIDKKQNIDTAISGQKRIIQFNQSYRKRYSEYNKLLILFIITLLSYGFLTFMKNTFTIIPESVFLLLITIVFSFATIYSVIIISRLMSRDYINFDEIVFSSPSEKDETTKKTSSAKNAFTTMTGGPAKPYEKTNFGNYSKM